MLVGELVSSLEDHVDPANSCAAVPHSSLGYEICKLLCQYKLKTGMRRVPFSQPEYTDFVVGGWI